MRMLHGDINVYWYHEQLTPGIVRAASYGTSSDSGALVPDEGDVIHDFPGLFGRLTTVRVTSVTRIGQGVTGFEVRVKDAPECAE